MPSNHLILCRPYLLRLQSSQASGSFPMSQFFTSGGLSTGVSASASVLPMNIQDWFPLMDWLDLLAVQGPLKSLLQNHSSKASILQCSAFFIVQLSHPYMTSGKNIVLTRRTFVGKVMLVYSKLSENEELPRAWGKNLSVKTEAISAAAKSLQSCPTLCDPVEGSPPGSSVHGIL